jgi:nitrogen regulatory protein PII
MKLITAIIRMDDLPVVMNAAADAGARGLTASKAIWKCASTGSIGDGKI